MITAKSYFSGAGGMDLGLSLAGIELIESWDCSHVRGSLRKRSIN